MNTKHFKDLLEAECKTLENELATVGRKNTEKKGAKKDNWEATESEDIDPAEDAEVANSIEIFENNKGVLNQLETQLTNVKSALEKIKNGTYGKCEVCGEMIEEDRLEANPSATTCKKHMNE